MGAITYTKPEAAAISKAFKAIEYLASTTNWTDSSDWAAAYKAGRKDSDSKVEAEYRMTNAWHDGLRAVQGNRPMSAFPYGNVDWYVRAYILGIRHAIERADHAKMSDCIATGPLAITAGETAQQRWLDTKGYES